MENLNYLLEKGWKKINLNFPFKNYINPARKSGYLDIVKKVAKWGGLNAKVLDFGCGPCDKTALFSLVGMDVTGYDTFEDSWVKKDNNKKKIFKFAKKCGIKIIGSKNKALNSLLKNKKFDVIMAHDVLEHFHSSPRILLNKLLCYLKTDGYLIISVPNAANLRKRLHLLVGKTNYNRYDYFYWYPGMWNGHVREYVKLDLELLNKYLKLNLAELSSYHLQLDVLPYMLRKPYQFFSNFIPSIKDTWMLVSQKPKNWKTQYIPSTQQKRESLGWHYFDLSKYKY